MLTIENFLVNPAVDNGREIWQVFLDGVLQISFGSEATALAFTQYVLKMEIYKKTYIKYQQRLINDFQKGSQLRKEWLHSRSLCRQL